MITTNIEETKKLYLDNMLALYHKKTNNSVLLDLKEYNSRIERLTQLENPLEKRLPSDSRLVKMCIIEVEEKDGTVKTKIFRRDTQLPYVPIEDLFDVIHDAHIKLNHVGRNALHRYLSVRYANITKDCIVNYLNTCIDCPRLKRATQLDGFRRQDNPSFTFSGLARSCKRFTSADFDLDNDDFDVGDLPTSSNVINSLPKKNCNLDKTNLNTALLIEDNYEGFSRAQVDIFNMEAEPDNGYKFIMRYTNLLTEEVRLCALRNFTAFEIADALITIYCEQGAPVVLQSMNGRELTEQIVNEVVKIWPQCRQLHAFNPFEFNQSAFTAAESDIIERLLNVMKETSSCSWVKSLRFLQWELNTTVNLESGKANIENSLGYIPTIGIYNELSPNLINENE